ncbi:MAG: hypothetical protein U0271_01065 [Polyangiaceae bacterium]
MKRPIGLAGLTACAFALSCGPSNSSSHSSADTKATTSGSSAQAATSTTPSARPTASSASARASASASASAPPPATGRVVPAAWQGTYVYADRTGPDSFVIQLVDANNSGVSPPRKVADVRAANVAAVRVGGPKRETVLYTTNAGDGPDRKDQLFVVDAPGAAPRKLAECAYECALVGIGADGEVWFGDRPMSLTGSLSHVPLAGGAVTPWGVSFTNCLVGGAMSPDGESMVVSVDNSLGWPECIQSGKQGLYVVKVTDKSVRDKEPTRLAPFTTKKASEINLGFQSVELRGGRLQFTVSDGWDPALETGATFTCGADGSDPKKLDGPPPDLAVRPLVVAPASTATSWLSAGKGADDASAVALVGPLAAPETVFSFTPTP